MAIVELKEAIILLKRMPSLWIPGIVGGILAAALWVTLNLSGTFFAGRLLLISGLVLILFTTGMLVIIRNNEGDLRTMLAGGIRYYFRVLLPQLIIIFGVIIIVLLANITVGLVGVTSDSSMVTALAIGFMIPTVLLTFFFDTAAVFEERKVFESIRRSIQLVMTHINDVIAFLFVCAGISIGIIFMLMIVWEAFLYDKLEPITRYNETQLQTFTPDQLSAMIGPGGMWITAIILFIGVFLLLPLLYTYKACFFRKLTRGAVITQQPTTGDYDSKGRWYKY
ncbi:MAG: hypothetical protein MUO95_08340 [Methanoregula sp.]|jgi:hypothetical protein|nr:hypothetical protein [Methanoregula sp.]